MGRDENANRERRGAAGDDAAARSNSDDLRYEGPVTFDDLDDDDDYGGQNGGGKVFLTAAVIGAAVILVVAVALWLRRDGPPKRPTDVVAAAQLPGPGAGARAPEEAPPSTAPAAPEPAPNTAPAAPKSTFDDAAAAASLAERPVPTEARQLRSYVPDAAAPPPAPRTAGLRPGTAPATDGDDGDAMRRLVAAGDLAAASRRGLSYAKRLGDGRYSLQVLFACEPATVKKAFGAVVDAELFVAPGGVKGGRECYRVLWGAYDDRPQALAAARTVPEYFRSAGSPWLVALDDIPAP